MSLRNKKTRKIINGCFVVCEYKDGARFSVKDKSVFDSLSELNEDWEDYEPQEPLIKDEKIRKAVQAWAKTIKAKSAFVEKPSYERADLILSDNFASISFPIDKPKELDFCKRYTIEELCGEEEG